MKKKTLKERQADFKDRIKVFSFTIYVIALVLAWIWFGWKLAVVLCLAFWGYNGAENFDKNRKTMHY